MEPDGVISYKFIHSKAIDWMNDSSKKIIFAFFAIFREQVFLTMTFFHAISFDDAM